MPQFVFAMTVETFAKKLKASRMSQFRVSANGLDSIGTSER